MYRYNSTYKPKRRKRRHYPLICSLLILSVLIICVMIVLVIDNSRLDRLNHSNVQLTQEQPATVGGTPSETQPVQAYIVQSEEPTPAPTPALALNAKYAVLYDVEQNTVLYEKNALQRCDPGSLTKLLTVLTASMAQGDAISYTVGDEIDLIGYNSSIAYLRKGDVLSFDAIVDAVMLSSGNDATYTLVVNLARYHGGNHLSDLEALAYFAEMMNETAQAIGCTDSNFVTVDGYPDTEHYSTAADLLRIAVAAANNETIVKSMNRSRSYRVFESGRDVVWNTTNKLLLKDSDYYYAYATGMKTGSTSSTDYSLAASAQKDGTMLIAIIVGTSSEGARFSDAIALFESVFSPAHN